jgi:hypothetical protein
MMKTVTVLGSLALAAGLGGFAAPAGAQELDINAIFWCEGKPIGDQTQEECEATRTAILTNCTSCHAFVPIVKAQKTPEEWDGTLSTHRSRVTQIADADYAQIKTFLAAHFNPENEPPKLPPELEALGTNQAF